MVSAAHAKLPPGTVNDSIAPVEKNECALTRYGEIWQHFQPD